MEVGIGYIDVIGGNKLKRRIAKAQGWIFPGEGCFKLLEPDIDQGNVQEALPVSQ